MAPARMRTVLPQPKEDLLGWLALRTGKKAVPEPAPWADSICRAGGTPATSPLRVRAGAGLLR